MLAELVGLASAKLNDVKSVAENDTGTLVMILGVARRTMYP